MWTGFDEESWGFPEGGGRQGFAFSGFPQISPSEFCFLFCRVFLAMLMQSTSVESTRSIPKNMSPKQTYRRFDVSGLCCVLDESRADSASLMHILRLIEKLDLLHRVVLS